MGRYKTAYSGERQTARVGIVMKLSDRLEVEQRAAKAGLSLSDYSRAMLLRQRANPVPETRDPAAIRALKAEIARVGNNINQLARIANETKDIRSQRALEAVSAQIMTALQRVIEL